MFIGFKRFLRFPNPARFILFLEIKQMYKDSFYVGDEERNQRSMGINVHVVARLL